MMMIAVCAGLFLGALGSAARFAQGNGHAGLGRWCLMTLCILTGLLYLPASSIAEYAAVAWFGFAAAANIAYGYTKWESIPYSFARYTLPAVAAVVPYIAIGGELNIIAYIAVGPIIAINQFVLAQHKPTWIKTQFDVATIPAGFAVVAPMVFL